jgi:hypothetical protein
MIETSIGEVLEFCDKALSDAEDLQHSIMIDLEHDKCINFSGPTDNMDLIKKINTKLNSMRNQLIVLKELDWESMYREKLHDECWERFP